MLVIILAISWSMMELIYLKTLTIIKPIIHMNAKFFTSGTF